MTTAEVETERPRRGGGKSKDNAVSSTPVQSRVRNKPRMPIIALAIALIIVSGLAAAYFYTLTARNTVVLMSATGIARGDVITAESLTTVEIPDGQTELPSVSVDRADDIIGLFATVDIPNGTLISAGNVADNAGLTPGTSIIGISLTAAQLPPIPLVNGDPVRLVETPVLQGDPPSVLPKAFSATVVSTKVDEVSGNTVVAVSVAGRDLALNIAARAATGRVALILDARETAEPTESAEDTTDTADSDG